MRLLRMFQLALGDCGAGSAVEGALSRAHRRQFAGFVIEVDGDGSGHGIVEILKAATGCTARCCRRRRLTPITDDPSCFGPRHVLKPVPPLQICLGPRNEPREHAKITGGRVNAQLAGRAGSENGKGKNGCGDEFRHGAPGMRMDDQV